MKKLLALVSAFALVFTSCSSEDDSSSSSSTGTKLTKLIETYNDGSTETTDYFYDGDKIVKIVNDYGDETYYTYTGNLITKTEEFYNDGSVSTLGEVVDFEYDSSDRLIRTSLTDEFGYVEVDDFTYNANGTISFITTSGGNTTASGIIYLSEGQSFKKELTLDPGTSFEYTTVEESFFDDKVNPMNSIVGSSKIEIACPSYYRGYEGVMNNLTHFEREGVTDWGYTYTYNSNNMPATDVYTDYSNSDYNSTSQYFYN